nr:FAD-dependent oxidoreductase [Pseudonocardia sp. ICBG601]
MRLDDGSTLSSAVVVNAAGPWSGRLNDLAGVGAGFTVGTRPMRQEVHAVTAPPALASPSGRIVAVADMDLGVYLRGDTGGGLLVGGTEPACDPLPWIDDPDDADPVPTAAVFDAQVTRAARRLPDLAVPNRPRGVAGVYDVADDWTPIYDRTELPGYYVAIGTSGNQFKNAPLVGRFLRAIIEQVEGGLDHDDHPVRHVGEHTGVTVDLSAFSRRRPVNADATHSVLG